MTTTAMTDEGLQVNPAAPLNRHSTDNPAALSGIGQR
jgi:hypothetical protein